MRKPKLSVLVIITLLFSAFTLGFFFGNQVRREEIVVTVSKEMTTRPTESVKETVSLSDSKADSGKPSFPIAINRANKEDFMSLPGIGEVLAQRIIAYRTANGGFSSVEELLNVEGIGKKRLEEILDLIVIGG